MNYCYKSHSTTAISPTSHLTNSSYISDRYSCPEIFLKLYLRMVECLIDWKTKLIDFYVIKQSCLTLWLMRYIKIVLVEWAFDQWLFIRLSRLTESSIILSLIKITFINLIHVFTKVMIKRFFNKTWSIRRLAVSRKRLGWKTTSSLET